MANNLSDYAENALNDWLLGGSTPTRPSARYLALFTAAPNDAGGGTEVSTGGYARKAVTFGASSGGASLNNNAPSWTASGAAYGLVTHIGVFDAVSSGNLLWHGAMTASKQVDDGDILTFAAGTLSCSLN